jgi:hypothetical protein
MPKQKIKAWHFVTDDRMIAHQTPPMEVAPGYIYGEPNGDIIICERGMHASRTVYDALGFARGSQLCRVQVWGDVAEQPDKIVGRYREVLAIRDVASELRLWGCWCIRNTPINGGKVVWDLLTDERSRKAIEVAERFARNEATREELGAASAAAWGAASAAAWGAAWDAAWAAARGAARAAWPAASAAASKFQADELERRMLALFGE